MSVAEVSQTSRHPLPLLRLFLSQHVPLRGHCHHWHDERTHSPSVFMTSPLFLKPSFKLLNEFRISPPELSQALIDACFKDLKPEQVRLIDFVRARQVKDDYYDQRSQYFRSHYDRH
jgi:hypothetical protein